MEPAKAVSVELIGTLPIAFRLCELSRMPDFTQLREQMIERQIAARGINDPHILAAFHAVPRHVFVAPANAQRAYGDFPIAIAAGQTISQPFVVAAMIEAAEIKPGD